jgi:twitching motility two-component system response regulator PilH
LARKILLADDSVTAQNMGRKILADAGYEVLTVNNGSAALKKIGEQKPDLIVLDVYMPGYSGLEVCQRLKEVGETARIPVLLTVGKLEPFKPEEAKRVRADAFIVKPFEASELLSALSKLEDKVVPRPEPSKPGRFARTIAAIEDREKPSTQEEVPGWKKRIAFPAKKKTDVEETDDADIYNPVNRDLRTKVETSSEKSAAKTSEERVDLGALATPGGLPADVTPEEIAALAAAAAQIKGKITEPAAEEKTTAAAEIAAPAVDVTESKETTMPATIAELNAEVQAVAPATQSAAGPSSAKFEAKEFEVAATPIAAPAQESKIEEAKIEETKIEEPHIEKSKPEETDEPVTMAVAVADSDKSARWTAVPVTLSADESSISLEQEMQKVSATDDAIPATASASPALEPAPAASGAPEAAETLNAIASAAADAVSVAVEQLQTVADSHVEPAKSEGPVEASAPVSTEPQATRAIEAAAVPEASAQQSTAPAEDPAPAVVEAPQPVSASHESVNQEIETSVEKTIVEKSEDRPQELPIDPPVAATANETFASQPVPAVATNIIESQKTKAEVATKESDLAASTAAAWASWRKIRESGDSKTTAAAAKLESEETTQETRIVPDVAAMAAAAGAEKTPEPGAEPEPDPSALASIVDGILADMRPKILEEVSKKLRNKP